MKYELIHKGSFRVVGLEGSTKDGEGFIPKLYDSLRKRFSEIQALVKKNPDGTLEGAYGLMSDFSRSFKPWENNFSAGLYLAGYELLAEVKTVPEGWTVWTVKEQDYFQVRLEEGDDYRKTFSTFVFFNIPYELQKLSGAVFDFYDIKEKQQCLLFPVVPFRFQKLPEGKAAHIACCGLVCSYCFFTSCPGCEREECKCTFAYWQPNHVCPNVKCAHEKGVVGCYACEKLEACQDGFFGSGNKSAKACDLFIKKHGKESLVKTIEKMNDLGLNWNKVLESEADSFASLRKLESYQ
jgi:Bacterial transcription activator, effector binding domain.